MSAKAPRPPSSLLAVIFLLNLIEFLHSGMIAFAASPIMGEIGAAPEEFSLAAACYASVAVTMIAKQRWLVERLGWRRFVLLSLLLFVAGCLICAASSAYPAFLFGRLVMALGGGTFMTSGRVVVQLIPPSPHRFTGIKYYASGLAVGLSLAPACAAWAVSNGDFSAIFLLLAALAVVTAVFAAFALPDDLVPRELRSQTHPLLLMAIVSGSFLLLYMLQRTQYDFYSDLLLLLAGGSAALLALYYAFRAIHRHERPLLALHALKNRRFVAGIGLFTCCYMIYSANNYMLAQLLQKVLGFAWQTIGDIQALGLSATLICWFVMTRMLPKWPGAKKFFVVGFGALALAGWQLAGITPDADLWRDVLPAILGFGVFIIAAISTTAMQTFAEVQHHEALLSHAAQIKNMGAQFSLALGTSLAVLFSQWRLTQHYTELGERFFAGNPLWVNTAATLARGLAPGNGQGAAATLAGSQLGQQLATQAGLLACTDYFSVIALVGVLAALVMLMQRLMK
jgi:MFS family permease